MMVSGLTTIVITTFLKVCTDVTSRRPVTIYRPQCPPGYCFLGDYAQDTLAHIPNYGVTLCFRATNNSSLLAKPNGFNQIWSTEHDGYDDILSGSGSGSGSGDAESKSTKIVALWRAIPPSDDYVSIGDLVTTSYEPPSTENTCVIHRSLVTMATAGRRVWKEYTGAASIWMTGRSDDYLDIRTFRTHDYKRAPDNFRAIILQVLPPQHKGTFVTRKIRGNELKLLYEHKNYEGQGGGFKIYVPQPPPGFVSLGFHAQHTHHSNQDAMVMVVRETASWLMLAPAGYQKVMEYNDHHNNSIVTYWRPISPPGYYCMGDIVTINDPSPPAHNIMVCLHWSLVLTSHIGERIWSSMNHGNPYTKQDFTLWGVGERMGCESPNTFITYPGYIHPPYERSLFHCIPSQDIDF